MMHSDWIEILIGTTVGACPLLLDFFKRRGDFCTAAFEATFSPPISANSRFELFAFLSMLTMPIFFNDQLSWHCPLAVFCHSGLCRVGADPGEGAFH